MSELLEIEALSVRTKAHGILQDFSLRMKPGEVHALLGPNGAGKSTAIRAALAIVPSHLRVDGQMVIGNKQYLDLAPRARAQTVAYVPQRSALRAPLLVREVVGHGAELNPAPNKALDALRKVDAFELADRRFTELSLGQQQRVLVARALATGAKWLFLDEPTASLDIAHALRIHALVTELSRDGFGVLMAMHDLAAVGSVATHASLLREGRLVAQGDVDTVLSDTQIRDVFRVQRVGPLSPAFRLVEESE